MTAAMFDLEPGMPVHAHTGPGCTFCEYRTGQDAKTAGTAAVAKDPEWVHRAERWLNAMHPGTRFTADDLVAALGKPMGSANQIGAILRRWAMRDLIDPVDVVDASRPESHGRLLRLWEKPWTS